MKRLNNRLRVAELADVSARLVEIYKSETSLAEDSFFKPLFDQIKEQALALSIAIKKENAISKLEELDEQRDNTIRDLKNALVGYASLRTAEIRESAEQLLTIFERYGLKVIRENYASQSGHIDSMLRDFSTEPALALVEKLAGVKEILEELKERQTAFNTERMAYEKSLSELGATPSASSLKKPLLDLLNVKLMNYLIATKEVEEYQSFAATVAQAFNEMNETIARRSKK